MKTAETIVRIGCGAGFADDRTDAAVPVVAALSQLDGPRFLIFETLAERTLALAQIKRRKNPDAGIGAVERFLRPILSDCLKSGIRIVSNFGAANPRAAARAIHRLAEELGHPKVRIAIVEGDDVTSIFTPQELARREIAATYLNGKAQIISANAYIGALEIAHGLDMGADIVVAGRVSDPSLALGPLVHAHGWQMDDWDRLASGTLVGHLLECGSQVTGGYFADPGLKDVPDLAEVGYPIAEVRADGSFVITKPEGTGGCVNAATVKEQMLYEIHDPSEYITPDVVLDITSVSIAMQGENRVYIRDAKGKPRTDTLKATVCLDGGYLAEGEISYAGPNAASRGRLAIDIIKSRLAKRQPGLEVRGDLIGVASTFNDNAGYFLEHNYIQSRDVRVRITAQSFDKTVLEQLLDEVRALYCAGPAGGAGIRVHLMPRLWSASCLLERNRVKPSVYLDETANHA
ncbi:acyclic terpene utilization AtuA family protein [Pseudochelatococcus lubricantis]|uniref:acyclic terpene utilization AtuA family protein n=1 Tax=Pseudochelatococcus lubricantis TaxID=1538102 RepID=UPI0035ECE6F1